MPRPCLELSLEEASDGGFFTDPKRPAVIRGAVSDWPARSLAEPDAWRQRFGSLELFCQRSASGDFPNFAADGYAEQFGGDIRTISELVDSLRQPTLPRYALLGESGSIWRRRGPGMQPQAQVDDHLQLGALVRECHFEQLVDPQQLYSMWLWLSGRDTRSCLHYDNNGCHNLNAQLSGHKQVWCYPPELLARLYPYPIEGRCPAYNASRLALHEFFAGEPARPEFAGHALADASSSELGPGDLLILPAHWLHAFAHTGAFNVNINAWWRPHAPPPDNPVAQRDSELGAMANQIHGGPHPREHQLLDPAEFAQWSQADQARLRRADLAYNRPL